ncbi:GHMP kinase [Halococcoides cellulosivorans]|uniref:Beta-ribofuranosylaminobenzene 5'-phosphate synthase n=1 Tax=Halococcoides cellulosivorans TaxID=1679096 RepID=A0A2R4X0B6_9EURY|nr:GHMP kinase [Halococcoides cellulosivorans]AWB27215.1 GHMP kinase [Halococcoides cellulosivorans]
MPTVRMGSRLHFGFQNLSLARERLYGGIGVGIAEPRMALHVERADTITSDDPVAAPYLEAACEHLDVPGAELSVRERPTHHAGFGTGTRLALGALLGVARAYDRSVDLRAAAPALDRAGRSGVGVATLEAGGVVLDGGHPTERFTTEPPARGAWTTPPVIARHAVPEDWRFLLVTPIDAAGPSGDAEDGQIRAAVERADPGIADEIATLVTQRLLPAIAAGDRIPFGRAITRLGRLNGAWYADEQGGVYRPPAGDIVDTLRDAGPIDGVGQSSWGPTIYGLIDRAVSDRAREIGQAALRDAGVEGQVRVVAPDRQGVTVG